MASTNTGEAVAELGDAVQRDAEATVENATTGEAVAELGDAVQRDAVQWDADATAESARSITVGQITDGLVGAVSGLLSGVVWVVQSLVFNKMEAPASAQASG